MRLKHRIEFALVRGGLDPVRMTFANSLLLPVAVAARLAQRRQWLPATAGLAGVGRLNSLLARVLGGEALWLRRQNLGWGLSLYALARRAASAG